MLSYSTEDIRGRQGHIYACAEQIFKAVALYYAGIHLFNCLDKN